LGNVRIDTFDGLMVEYAKSIDAMCVLRGIRAISDYEYELQMALMNRKLEPTLETVFMMPAVKYSYVSSRLVREVAQAGGPVKDLVPDVVEQKLREKLDPAYKLRDAKLIEVPRKRKKKSMTTATTEALNLPTESTGSSPPPRWRWWPRPTNCAQQGIDVVDFGAGEPHFARRRSTSKTQPSRRFRAISRSIHAVAGTAELRDAIVHRHNVDFDSDYRREEAIASTGGKHALFNAIQVLVDHGDEVILPVPYWVSFKDIVRYAGGIAFCWNRTSRRAFASPRRWWRG
jgi:hypothetical protein